MKRKYEIPRCISVQIDQVAYQRWLGRIALAHVKRDRRRGNTDATREVYMRAMHEAVIRDGGRDSYTGEALRWDLISKYDNAASAVGKRAYKAQFALKPTVDHVGDGTGPANFRICAWRTNQAKGDLEFSAFLDLCRRVVEFHDDSVCRSPRGRTDETAMNGEQELNRCRHKVT